MKTKLLNLTLMTSILVACVTEPNTGARVDTLIAVEYGIISNVEEVELDANHATGALVGGGLGVAAASRRSAETQAAAAIAGALIGALVADSQKKPLTATR